MYRCLLASFIVLAAAAGVTGRPDDKPAGKPTEKFKLTNDEQKLLDLLNQTREKEKLPPLEPNETLTRVARAHAANMAKQEKMAHVLDGKRPAQRVEEAGYDYRFVGENVAMSEGDDVTLADIHDGWMKSKVHRDNILKKEYREVGLGLAQNAKGQTYYAQVFGTRRRPR
jgi:uncharacterized protein YkwD